MSRMPSRGLSAPAAAKSAIWPGPGRPARSGSTPEATPVVRTALRSRVPVYLTVLPVSCSHGATICLKAASSSPPQVPITVTLPPVPPEPLGLEQAATTSIAAPMTAAARRQDNFRCCIQISFPGKTVASPLLLRCPPARVRSGPRSRRLLVVRRSRRGPHDQLGRQQGPVREGPAGDPIEERRPGRHAKVEGGQPDGRQGRVEEAGEGDVVEADDRDVGRDAEAGFADRRDGAEGDD